MALKGSSIEFRHFCGMVARLQLRDRCLLTGLLLMLFPCRGRPVACRAAHHFAKTRTPPECVSLRSCHGGGVPGTLRRVHRNYFLL
jgi:hypothetical protein